MGGDSTEAIGKCWVRYQYGRNLMTRSGREIQHYAEQGMAKMPLEKARLAPLSAASAARNEKLKRNGKSGSTWVYSAGHSGCQNENPGYINNPHLAT